MSARYQLWRWAWGLAVDIPGVTLFFKGLTRLVYSSIVDTGTVVLQDAVTFSIRHQARGTHTAWCAICTDLQCEHTIVQHWYTDITAGTLNKFEFDAQHSQYEVGGVFLTHTEHVQGLTALRTLNSCGSRCFVGAVEVNHGSNAACVRWKPTHS